MCQTIANGDRSSRPWSIMRVVQVSTTGDIFHALKTVKDLEVSLQQASDHCERTPILDALGSMRCSSWDISTTLFHTLKTVKGLLHLVPPRTPRSSGYGVLYICVYVTCYFCYMFSLGPSSGSTGSVRVYRKA